jgi:putative hydrolase of the HAD superfamily
LGEDNQKKKMIKVVAFDYGGVLGSESDGWHTSLVAATGLKKEEIEETLGKYWDKLKIGEVSVSNFWQEISELSKFSPDLKHLEKLYERGIHIDDDVLNIAQKVKQKGYEIVVLSNEAPEWMDQKRKKFCLDDIFKKVYCSGYLKMAKPDEEIYKYVLNDLAILSNELLFIDNLSENTEAAEKLGIKTVVFESPKKLEEELSQFVNLF